MVGKPENLLQQVEVKLASSVLETPWASLSPCHCILCYSFPPCSYANTNCVWLHSESLETSDVKNENNNNFLTIFFHLHHQLHLQDKISNFNHSETTFKSSSLTKKK